MSDFSVRFKTRQVKVQCLALTEVLFTTWPTESFHRVVGLYIFFILTICKDNCIIYLT